MSIETRDEARAVQDVDLENLPPGAYISPEVVVIPNAEGTLLKTINRTTGDVAIRGFMHETDSHAPVISPSREVTDVWYRRPYDGLRLDGDAARPSVYARPKIFPQLPDDEKMSLDDAQ